MKKSIRNTVISLMALTTFSALAVAETVSGLTLLREDFNQSALDTTVWSENLPATEPDYVSISDGYLVKHGKGTGLGHDLLSKQSFGPGTRFEFRASVPWSKQSCVGVGITRLTSNFHFNTCWNNSSSGHLVLGMAPDSDVNTSTTAVPLMSDVVYVLAIDYGKDGIIRFYADGKFIAQNTTPVTEMVYFYIGTPYDNNIDLMLDWVKISTL